MKWNIVFSNTQPSDKNLRECLNNNLSSPHPWDIRDFFSKCYQSLEGEVREVHYIGDVVPDHLEEQYEEEYFVFDIKKMIKKIASMKVKKEVLVLVRNEEIDIGK